MQSPIRNVKLGVGAVLLAATAGCGANASQASQPAPAVAGSPGAPPASAQRIVASISIQATYLPIWFPKEAGIYAKNGLDVDLQVLPNTTGVAGLIGGQAQIANGSGAEVIAAAASGADLVVFATVEPVYTQLVVAASSIKTPADLKGQKLGVTNFGSGSDLAGRVALRSVGLNPDADVVFTPIGSGSNGKAALENGSVQAAVVMPADAVELRAKGMNVLVDLSTLKQPAVTTVSSATRQYVAAHRDVIQRYVDSLVQGAVRARQDRPLAVKVLKQYLKSDDDESMALNYDYLTREAVTPALPHVRAEQFADAKQFLAKSNPQVADFGLSTILDDSFVENAASRQLDSNG